MFLENVWIYLSLLNLGLHAFILVRICTSVMTPMPIRNHSLTLASYTRLQVDISRAVKEPTPFLLEVNPSHQPKLNYFIKWQVLHLAMIWWIYYQNADKAETENESQGISNERFSSVGNAKMVNADKHWCGTQLLCNTSFHLEFRISQNYH